MKAHIASVLQSIHVQTRTRTTEVHLRTLQSQNLQFERLLREREHEIDILRHQLANLEARLQEMGGTDVLTSLPNRHVFTEQLTLSLKRALRLGYSLSLMLVDIDHLREINLRHGYEVGDAVLVEVAQILKSSVREIDMISRWGGEELAAVLHETDSEGAAVVAERIRKKIARLEIIDPKTRKPFKVTATLSVASYPAHSHEVQGLLESAGEALIAAKLGGCNKVVVATR
jgi:diguanylate cyclase (GGDEF)-like protein